MRAYERFLKYVTIYTTSDEESTTHPSTARQFDLAHLLVAQLKELGVADAAVDDKCYVYGTLPATPGYEEKPALGFVSHMDTAPAAPGENVKPQVFENYDGGDVLFAGTGEYMTVEKFPELANWKGQTLITADGTTLLGADDKAGIAEIMTAVERIQKENIPHGKICIGFTPDEEVGQGADFFDVDRFGAQFAYTVDGGDVGELEYQNFNAADAVVTVHGFSVHPGSAKDLMKNAQTIAMEFAAALPAEEVPEHTEGFEGFFHLYQMSGDVTTARLHYIIRDHDGEKFAARKALMEEITARLNAEHGAGTVVLELKDSYYNMEEKVKPHFHLIENAEKAIRKAGLEAHIVPIRGGTDGARLSFMGLPCPNLGTGGFNFHGPCEYITAEKMDKSVEIILNIIAIYAEN
ncbi:peptidase T [Allofournierella massiliensis]|uniref:Peptidase T n=1 Tax=Allofournierella massiliensis TaxID=1650663 RepID=A0A4R1QPQ6_9FIRM|nr:peptidase T [Fournierella massiliensis]TCL55796.1 tripeptide aminopeptidase [Fournierella massiliensis]